ncbi:hypothetical protein SAMN02983003_2564 [Devosia enhydra]|uniref:Sensory transduction regulator n=1 Tax=Devosia enhydra TaxID=665118 RepID=A0A1K2HZ87_9HYPH|nr:hypothetical protein [Devosia enhydra]SFZ85401.1 hypothetical protein SAMN02983003_2564 [Devosia enhydra]
MTSNTIAFKHDIALKTFLAEMEWDDEVAYDFDQDFAHVTTSVSVGGNYCLLIVEAYNNDMIDIYIYMRYMSVKESQSEQMQLLLSTINSKMRVGAFQFLPMPDQRVVRWHHATDFEGSNPTGTTIRLNVVNGLETVKHYADLIAAVALTNQKADAAFAEFMQTHQHEGENTH